MKRMSKHFLSALALLSTASMWAHVVTTILPRSESWQAARELVGTRDQVNLYGKDWLYGTFFVMPGYDQTFRSREITELLFDDALSDASPAGSGVGVKISGSQVEDRGSNDLLAEYFGLAPDFQSMIKFEPKISNFFMDFNFYLGLDRWVEGLYFRIHAPFVHTRWQLGFCEQLPHAGQLPYAAGYFNGDLIPSGVLADNPVGVLHANLLQKFADYAINEKTPNLGNTVRFEPLRHAKMYTCAKSANKLSDIQMALGWNFWQREDYHFGLQLRSAAPTGSRVRGTYLFEPLIGNGHHWELGGGLDAHWLFWRAEDDINHFFSLYVDANLTHLFKTRQCRTFDLCGKPLSRYMLAQKMTNEVTGGLSKTHDGSASAQCANVFTPVANLTTLKVDSSVGFAGELVLMLAWNHHNWNFDIGYDYFGQSSEHISTGNCDVCCPSQFAENTWTLKGDAYVYGFNLNTGGTSLINPTGLSAAESQATIFAGTNVGQTDAYYTNPGVDAAAPASNTTGSLYEIGYSRPADALEVNSSFDPIFIKESDIDLRGVRISDQKIFAHISYTWREHENWIPYFGVGGEVQFSPREDDCCPTGNPQLNCAMSCTTGGCKNTCSNSCSACDNDDCDEGRESGLWSWGIWLKGGVSFD